jgi:hypothetical protein
MFPFEVVTQSIGIVAARGSGKHTLPRSWPRSSSSPGSPSSSSIPSGSTGG